MNIDPGGKPAGFNGQPTLQVGGEQDALMEAAPDWGVEMVQAAPAVHPEVPPADSAAGEEETQVSGALGTMQP